MRCGSLSEKGKRNGFTASRSSLQAASAAFAGQSLNIAFILDIIFKGAVRKQGYSRACLMNKGMPKGEGIFSSDKANFCGHTVV